MELVEVHLFQAQPFQAAACCLEEAVMVEVAWRDLRGDEDLVPAALKGSAPATPGRTRDFASRIRSTA